MDNIQLNIGEKVKGLRESKGLTGYELAKKSGITEARLMAFEEGYATPTIAILMKISEALGVGMGFFFQDETPPKRVEVVRADQRREVKAGGKEGEDLYYSYQSLSPTFMNKRLQPFYVEVELVEPKKIQPASHPGEEFVYVLEGIIEWNGGDEVYKLGPGDTIHFDSEIPHRIIGLGDVKPKVITVLFQSDRSA